jgi:hypothetical protein
MSEIDSLLDSTLDDLEDLPTFEPFVPGVHRVLATLKLTEVNSKSCVEITLKGLETLELANPADAEKAIKEGDSCNTIFMLDNEYGRGNLKKVAMPIGEALGTTTIRDTVEQANDVECVVATAVRVDKSDPDRKYLNIKELNVV